MNETSSEALEITGLPREVERGDRSAIDEWRFFAGLSVEEIAALLVVSDRTVKRRWRSARALLLQDLAAQGFAQ